MTSARGTVLAWLRRVGRHVPAMLLLVALGHPSPCAAAQDRLRLEMSAPPGCPTSDAASAQIRAAVDTTGDGPAVVARLVITEDGDGYHLALETRSGDAVGQRTLDGQACDELTSAAAMIVAWMIDPDTTMPAAAPARVAANLARPHMRPTAVATTHEVDTTVAGADETGTAETSTAGTGATETSAAETPAARANAGTPRREEPVMTRLGLRGAFDVGSLPNPMGALTATVAVGVPVVEGRLRASALFPSDSTINGIDGAGSTTYAFSVEGLACVRPFDEARFLTGCAGLVLGVLVAEGHGLARPASGAGVNLGASVDLDFTWPILPELELELGAGLLVPFTPFSLALGADGAERVFYTQEPVAGRFGLGANVVF